MPNPRQVTIMLNIETKGGEQNVEKLASTVKSASAQIAKDEIAAIEAVAKVRKEKEVSESDRIKRRAKEIADAAKIEMALLERQAKDDIALAGNTEAQKDEIRKKAYTDLNSSIGQSLTALRQLGDGGAVAYLQLQNALDNTTKRVETGNTAFKQLLENTAAIGNKFQQANQQMASMVLTLKQLEAAGQKNGAEYKAIQQQLGAVSGEASKLEQHMKSLEQAGQRQASGLAQGFDNLKKQLGPIGDKLGGLGTQLGAVTAQTLASGDATSAIIGGFGAAASAFGPFGQAASVAIGILGAVIGKVETAGQAAKRTREEFEASVVTFNTVNASFTQMAESIVNGDIIGAAEELQGSMGDLAAISVEAANELESLVNAPGDRTSSELARIDELMGEINAKASEEMMVKQYDAALASLENIGNVVGDILDEQDAWYESVLEFLVPMAGIADRIEDIKNLSADASKAGIEGMKARSQLNKIENEYQKVFIENLRAGMSMEETMKGIREESGAIGEQELKIIAEQGVEAKKQFELEQEREKKKSVGYIAEQKALKDKAALEEKQHKEELKRIEDAKDARLKAIEDAKKAAEKAQGAVDSHKDTLAKEKQKIQESFEDGNISKAHMDARIKAIESIAAQLDSVVINKDTDVKALSAQFEESMHQYNRTVKKADEEARKLADETKKKEEEAKKLAEERAKKAAANQQQAILNEYKHQEELFNIKEEQIYKEKAILKDLENFSNSLLKAAQSHVREQANFVESLTEKSFGGELADSYTKFVDNQSSYIKELKGSLAQLGDQLGELQGRQARNRSAQVPIANEVANLRGTTQGRDADDPIVAGYIERLKVLEPQLQKLSADNLELLASIDTVQKKIADTNTEIANTAVTSNEYLARYGYLLNELVNLDEQIVKTNEALAKTTDPADEKRLNDELDILLAKYNAAEQYVKDLAKMSDSDSSAAQILFDMSRALSGVDLTAFDALISKFEKLDKIAINRSGNDLLKQLAVASKLADSDPNEKNKLKNLEALSTAQAAYNKLLNDTLTAQETQIVLLDRTSPEYAVLADDIQATSKAMWSLADGMTATNQQIAELKADELKQKAADVQSLFASLKIGLEGIGSADMSSAFDSIFSSMKNLSSATATGAEKLQSATQMATGFAAALASIPDAVDRYTKDFAADGAVSIVKNVSTDLTSIGSALMGSGVPPLMAAGAAILAVGIIGQIIAKLVAAIDTPEKRALRASEARLTAQEGITAEYERQEERSGNLLALESALTDTARERLDLLKQQHHQNTQGGIPEIEAQLAAAKANVAALLADANAASPFMIASIRMGQEIVQQLEDQLTAARGTSALAREVAGFTNDALASEIARTKAVTANYEAVEDMTDQQRTEYNLAMEYLGLLEQENSYRTQAIVLQKQMRAELQSTRTLLIDIALRSNSYAKALRWSNKNLEQSVIDVNSALGTSFKSADEAMQFLNTQGVAYFQNLSEEQRGFISTLMSGYESVGDAVFSDAENLLNLRREAGVFSEDEEENSKLAKQALLDLYNAELARLIGINATEEERLEIQIKINDILAEQNAELDDQDKKFEKLNKLVREQQRAVQTARAGGTDSISSSNQAVRNELVQLGWSEADIAKFMASLPGRAEGGPMTSGLYQVGERGTEWAINNAAVKKYGADFFERLNNLQVPIHSPFAGGESQGGGSNMTFEIDWNPTYNISGGDPNKIREVVANSDEELFQKVNQGIKSRRIAVTAGGRS